MASSVQQPPELAAAERPCPMGGKEDWGEHVPGPLAGPLGAPSSALKVAAVGVDSPPPAGPADQLPAPGQPGIASDVPTHIPTTEPKAAVAKGLPDRDIANVTSAQAALTATGGPNARYSPNHSRSSLPSSDNDGDDGVGDGDGKEQRSPVDPYAPGAASAAPGYQRLRASKGGSANSASEAEADLSSDSAEYWARVQGAMPQSPCAGAPRPPPAPLMPPSAPQPQPPARRARGFKEMVLSALRRGPSLPRQQGPAAQPQPPLPPQPKPHPQVRLQVPMPMQVQAPSMRLSCPSQQQQHQAPHQQVSWWRRFVPLGGRPAGGGGGSAAPGGTTCLVVAHVPGEAPRLTAARAILYQASKLPPPRRHELLTAAAALPELAFVFASASATAGGGRAAENSTDAARQSLEPAQPASPALQDLQAKLRALRKGIAAAPAAAPPRPPSASAPVPTPQPPAAAEAAASSATGEAAAGAAPPPPPPDALTLTLVPEYEQYGVAAGETLRAVVSIKAAAEVRQRAHVALSCVLDRSGSMGGERIELVRETTHFLIDQLDEGDYLGLISYSGQVREDLPLVRMTPEAKALAHAVVGGMAASGSTALYDGLAAGVRQQMDAERELAGAGAGRQGAGGGRRRAGGDVAAGRQELEAAGPALVHSCFLFTDGQATDGPTQPDEILAGLAALQAPGGHHVTVHTFGFGEGHSVDLLRAVADAQSGVYYYIAGSDDIAGGFGDALGGLLAVVAKDIRVTVRPAPGVHLTAFRSGGRAVGAAGAGGGGGSGAGGATLRSAATSRATSARRGGAAAASGAGGGGCPAESGAPAGAAAAAAVPTGAAFNDMFAEESRECLLVLSLPAVASGDAPPPPAVTAPGPTPGGDLAAPDATAAAAPPPPQPSVTTVVTVAGVDLEYTDVASGARVVVPNVALRVARSPASPRPAGQDPLPAELVFVTAARFETLDAIEAAQAAQAAAPDGQDVGAAHAVLDAQLERLAGAPGALRGSVALAALSEQARAARESIRPRYQFTQTHRAAVAGTVQALRQQRVGTASEADAARFSTCNHTCKAAYRQRATTAVSSIYLAKKSR